MIARCASEGQSKYKTQHFSRAFKEVFQNHAQVFTHADFQRKNIMFRKPPATTENGLVQWASTDLELAIIDWEFAGWYPSYWECSRALFGCGTWEHDWSEWIEKMLEPYRNDYAWYYYSSQHYSHKSTFNFDIWQLYVFWYPFV